MSELDYDDGLVHGHRWATEPERRTSVTIYSIEPTDEPFDDGLVHCHNWAAENVSR
jgi:hypothetical protein